MELSTSLRHKIIEFLKTLPNIGDTKSRQAFIYSVGLDRQLYDQISFNEPPAQFVPLLVSTLLKYGRISDGRSAINALLEVTKSYIGQDKQLYCDTLIQELSKSYLASENFLSRQTRIWFETLGYRFENYHVQVRKYFEWIINIPARRGYDRILVRGVEGEANILDFNELCQKVEELKIDEGWLIAAQRIASNVRQKMQQQSNCHVFCYTFDELLDEQADFTGYLDWLKTEVAKKKIDKEYVPLACTKPEYDPATHQKYISKYDNIDHYISQWLDDPAKGHISILGEFGTGKTWFSLHYAWIAMQRYQQAKEKGIKRPRLPLFIPLRDYAKAVSIESLFSEFFFRKHEIPLSGYSVFEQLNRMGKFLLIFDGFDEMADRVDRQKMINNFWELARAIVPGSKIILTSRTEHFPNTKESRALLSAELQASTSILTGEPPQFEILNVEKFNEKQIQQVLSFHASPSTISQIMENPQLRDLATRPVMISLICDALPDIEHGKKIDLSRIYLYAVQHQLGKINTERSFTSTADKVFFLCELSWQMLSNENMSINYRLFPEQLRRLFSQNVKEQKELDHWHYDMMGQTMLIRDEDGNYTPAHRSLLEFFVAYKFTAEIGALADDFLVLAQSQSYLDKNKPSIDYRWSEYFQRQFNEYKEVLPIPPLNKFIPETAISLASTIGKEPLSEAILDLMINMVEDPEQLWYIIQFTQKRTFEEIRYLGGNIANILLRLNVSFENRNLSDCNLTGTSFNFIKLCHANLTNTIFDEGSLVGADLRNVKGVTPRLFSAVLPHTDWLYRNDRNDRLKFIGRTTELTIISELIADQQNNTSCLCIVGEGGLGKTRLMYEAIRKSNELVNQIFLFDCDEPGGLQKFLVKLATFLYVAGYDKLLHYIKSEDQDINIDKLSSILLEPFEKEKFLICIDTLDATEKGQKQFEALIQILTRFQLKTFLLLASRRFPEHWKELKPNIKIITLKPLTDDEAKSYIIS